MNPVEVVLQTVLFVGKCLELYEIEDMFVDQVADMVSVLVCRIFFLSKIDPHDFASSLRRLFFKSCDAIW